MEYMLTPDCTNIVCLISQLKSISPIQSNMKKTWKNLHPLCGTDFLNFSIRLASHRFWGWTMNIKNHQFIVPKVTYSKFQTIQMVVPLITKEKIDMPFVMTFLRFCKKTKCQLLLIQISNMSFLKFFNSFAKRGQKCLDF